MMGGGGWWGNQSTVIVEQAVFGLDYILILRMDQSVPAAASMAEESKESKIPSAPQAGPKKVQQNGSSIGESMVNFIGDVLESISKMHVQKPYRESAFSAKVPPAISIKNYIKRIFKYLYCSQPVVIVTLIFIDRFQQRNPELPLNDYCIHRVTLIAAVVAAKCTDDKFYSNSHYAKVLQWRNQAGVTERPRDCLPGAHRIRSVCVGRAVRELRRSGRQLHYLMSVKPVSCKPLQLSNMNDASESSANFEGVEVIIRLKPLSPDENDPDQRSCVTVSPTENNTVIVETPNKKEYFSFDHVASEDSQQQDIFDCIGRPVIDESLKGYNCCIFAYGQTGAGKTYSILGDAPQLAENPLSESRGVLPRLLEDLFDKLSSASCKYQANCSYLQIYNEQIIDLLNKQIRSYPIREDCKRGVYVQGLSQQPLTNYQEALHFIFRGLKNRKVASTSMNSESSRSHTIFTVNLKMMEDKDGTQIERFAKVHVVDLAGSERQRQTNVSGERLKEGCNINRSLHCLGNVINSLVESIKKKKYIPFRDSKLTFFLKDSLGGNSKTKLLANINPRKQYLGDTISTLMFAKRAKILKVRVEANQTVVDNFDSLRAEIRKLREELSQAKFIKNSMEVSKLDQPIRPVEIQKQVIVREKTIDIDFCNDDQVQKVVDVFSDNENNYRMLISLYQQRLANAQKPLVKADYNFKQLFEEKRILEKQNNNYQQLLANFPAFTKLFKDNLALRKKVRQLQGDVNKVNKEKQEIIIQIEHVRNNNVFLKEQRDDLETSMIHYKTEVDHVLASGLKTQQDKNVQYQPILPLLQLSRLQDQAALNMTKRQDIRDLMNKQNSMLQQYQTIIQDLKINFSNHILQLQQNYEQLSMMYEQQKDQKLSLKKMKRPQQSPQIQTLQNQNEYLKLNIMQLENEIGRYEQQSFKNAIEIRTLEESNEKMSKQLYELRESNESNGMEEGQLVGLLNRMREIKMLAEREHMEVEEEFEREESEYNNLKEKIVKLTQENAILVNKIQVLHHRCKELKKRFGQSSKSTTIQVSDEISNEQQYFQQSTVITSKLSQLTKQIALLTSQKVDLQKQLQQQSMKNAQDRSKLQRTSMKILSVSKQLARLKQENEHEVEELRRMQIRLDQSEKEKNSLKEKQKMLEIEGNRVRKELDRREQLTNRIKIEFNKTETEIFDQYRTMETQIHTLKNELERSRADRYKKGYSSSSRSLKNYNTKQPLNHTQTSVEPFTIPKAHLGNTSSVQKKQRLLKTSEKSAQKSREVKKSTIEKKDLLSSTYAFSSNTKPHDTSGDFMKTISSMTPDAGKSVGVFSKSKKPLEKTLEKNIEKSVHAPPNIPPSVPKKKC